MHAETGTRPRVMRFGNNPFERADGQCLVRLVLQKQHLTAEVMVPDEPGERCDRALFPRVAGRHLRDERREVEWRRGDCHGCDGHALSIPARIHYISTVGTGFSRRTFQKWSSGP